MSEEELPWKRAKLDVEVEGNGQVPHSLEGRPAPIGPAPIGCAKMPLGRLQRIVTGAQSKAMQLKDKPRTAASTKARTRCSGKLALMLQIPVDVFCEIATHLSPLDLLHLARLTRQLRGMLMSKNARWIWRAALNTRGIPACPSDINEPQLTSLIFEKFCHGCGAPRVQKIDFSLRVRLCVGCFDLKSATPNTPLSNLLTIFTSFSVVCGSKLSEELAKELDNFRDDDAIYRLCCNQGAFVFARFSLPDYVWSKQSMKQRRFFRPDFVDAVRRYLSYEPESDGQRNFVEARKQSVNEISAHAHAIENWLRQEAEKKAIEDVSKSQSRRDSILKRLKSLGYTDEDFDQYDTHMWKWDNLLNQPRELTEKIWKRILPQLEEIIHLRRESEHRRVLEERYVQRRTELEYFYRRYCTEWWKRFGEPPSLKFSKLLLLPEVKAVIERDEGRITINECQWGELRGLLHDAFFCNGIKEDCCSLVVSARIKAGLAPLPFKGTGDKTAAIVGHASAFFSDPRKPNFLGTYNEIIAARKECRFGHGPELWPLAAPPSPSVPRVAEALIRSLGMPEMVTMDEMERLGRSFVCKCCMPGVQERMTWKDLITHFCAHECWAEYVLKSLAVHPENHFTAICNHNINERADLAVLVLAGSIEEAGDEYFTVKVPANE